jgi:L-asparaginase
MDGLADVWIPQPMTKPVNSLDMSNISNASAANQVRVLLIYTGGTIGMIRDPYTSELKPFKFERLLSEIPELAKFQIQIDSHTFSRPIDSSDMHPSIWIELADLIAKRYDDYDGFVILHGTDTMSYTAAGLSFLLENLNKPVILTGAQLPIGTIRTDGKENLITAIEIAASKHEGMATVPEVAIYFEYKLYRGNRTRKYNAEHFDAFESPNHPVLAEAGVHITFNLNAIARSSNLPLKIHRSLDLNVAVLKLFPGIQPEFVHAVLSARGLKGLVLETFGSGNGPTSSWFLDALRNAIESGLIVVNISQCAAGRVEMGRYETSTGLAHSGVISGQDMTTEAALAKLMFLLGTETSADLIKKKLLQSLAGELTLL